MSKQHSCRLIGTTTLLFLFMSTSALAAQGMRAARTRAAGKNHRVREAGARQGAALLLGKRSVEPRARSLSAGGPKRSASRPPAPASLRQRTCT